MYLGRREVGINLILFHTEIDQYLIGLKIKLYIPMKGFVEGEEVCRKVLGEKTHDISGRKSSL